MPTVFIQESAAGTAVGNNLTAGHRIQTSPMYRRVKRAGVAGSAVLRDGGYVDIYYGATYMASLVPTTIGVVQPVSDKDMFFLDQNTMLKPGESLNCLISKISVTNPVVLAMEIEEIHPQMFAARRSYGGGYRSSYRRY